VIGINGVLPVFQVTGIALRREAEELADSRTFVAGITLHSHVSAEQWKTVIVIFHALWGDIPRLGCVALRAVGAHLTPVNVCVAVSAILADVGEDRLEVALYAVHFFVLAA
jgi:hypothetical protein